MGTDTSNYGPLALALRRRRHAGYVRRYRASLRAAGLCVDCKQPTGLGAAWRCAACAALDCARRRTRRWREELARRQAQQGAAP